MSERIFKLLCSP